MPTVKNPKINPRREIPKKKESPRALPKPKDEAKPKAAPEKKTPFAEFSRTLPTVPVTKVPVAKLVTGVAQMRPRLDQDVIERYRDAYEEKAPIPPIVVFADADGKMLVGDGHLRTEAAKLVGFKTIEAFVHQGTPRDALAFSVGANATHGRDRDRATMRNAVETLLADEEWGKMSVAQIASAAKVSHKFARDTRDEWHVKTGKPRAATVTTKDGKTRAATASKPSVKPKETASSNGQASAPQAPPPPAAANRPTDAEWLETMPVRKELAPVPLKVYDRDALKYRSIVESPQYDALKALATGVLDLKGQPASGLIHSRLVALVRIPHPRDAKVCQACGGKGHTNTGPCGACNANGYTLV